MNDRTDLEGDDVGHDTVADDYKAPSIVDIDTASDREFAVLPGGSSSNGERN